MMVANVLLSNAIALQQHKPEMGAPRVFAKGVMWPAQKIKEEGRLHDIPTAENVPSLVLRIGVSRPIRRFQANSTRPLPRSRPSSTEDLNSIKSIRRKWE
jgi:hypothetical protein